MLEKKFKNLYFNTKRGGEIDMTHTGESDERKTHSQKEKKTTHTNENNII